MKTKWPRWSAFSLVLFFAAASVFALKGEQNTGAASKISSPGKYKGYSNPVYDEWVRISQYVPVRDGTRLAVDIFRPSRVGKPVSEPLPLIWTLTPYRRAARLPNGKLATALEQMSWLPTILKHGYIVASVDIRGGGASFGFSQGAFSPDEATDAYDITEWFAAQPWCSGKIGMYGVSYQGITQYMAASMAPPHLVAIMPDMAMFDVYSFSYPGGVFQDDFSRDWSNLVKMMDTAVPAVPVDEDPDSELMAEALKEHQKNIYPSEQAAQSKFRDDMEPGTSLRPNLDWSPHAYLKGIRENGARIAVYHVSGWFDMWPRDAVTWFNNLNNPQKILIAPWSHSHDFAKGWKETIEPLVGFVPQFDCAAEQLRWFDCWLKGIDNGIMTEPPIYYFTMGAPEGEAWKFARQWPLPEQKRTPFYFQAGPSRSITSTNDGLLGEQPPSNDSGQDDYVVNYTTASGTSTRWHNGRGGAFKYPDMAANDAKALTYTTAPLKANIEVTGHPIVHLWVTSTANDGDFFAYLEEVDENGFSHYITEGVLRASYRKLGQAPYNYMNLPYHRSFAEDMEPLPAGQPVELVFDLHPTSNVFNAGHRIRLTLTCADQPNFETPELSPAPTVSVYRIRQAASYVELPVIPKGGKEEAAKELILSTTLIVIGVVIVVIMLFFLLRRRLRK